MRIQLLLALTFLLVFQFDGARASPVISNDLPKDLVSELFDEAVWENRFDDANSPEARDLRAFLQFVTSTQADPDAFVDNLFGSLSANEGDPGTLPRLYPAKIIIFRYYLAHGRQNRESLARLDKRWKAHYLELATSMAKLAGISELGPVIDNFWKKVSDDGFVLADLSPRERQRLVEIIGKQNGERVLARLPGSKKFEVTGLYNDRTRYFGIDFARPIEETVVTFVHEMMHAADPRLTTWRARFDRATPAVLAAITRWLPGSAKEAGEIAGDILSHVFFETGINDIADLSAVIRARRIDTLREVLEQPRKNTDRPQPTEAELSDVSQWIRAAIGLTLENEYRAYGFSLIAYSSLKNRVHATLPSPRHQRLVERLLSGDDVFAANLSVGLDPFRQARSDLFRKFLERTSQPLHIAGHLGTKEEDLLGAIGQALDRLELSYLQQTQAFLQGLNEQFAGALREIARNTDQPSASEAAGAVLPDWARPGGFDLPSNPYHVLSARITTAWVLRFRQTVGLVLEQLKHLNEPLVTTRLGILDLHDVTRGERKLLGLSYQDSPWAVDPNDLEPGLAADLDSLGAELPRYFSVVRWSPKAISETGGSATRMIPASMLSENLTRLRAIKALMWMDRTFPPFKTALLGSKNFLQRIRDGIYSVDDLTRAKADELEEELKRVWQTAGVTRDEFMRMELLWREVFSLRQLADERKWPELESALVDKNHFVVQMLEQVGVFGNTNIESLTRRMKEDAAAFEKQMQKHFKQCRKASSDPTDVSRLSGFWLEKGPFAVGEYSFPLTLVCFQKKLYAVRQPGDFIRFMTTQIRDGVPEARIFTGGRPVELAPLKFTERAKEKSGWFGW